MMSQASMTPPDRRAPGELTAAERYLHLVEGAAHPARTARTPVEHVERALNLTIALVGLVLTLPVWLVVALVVKLTSRGPVFYTQVRVGIDTRGGTPTAHDPRRKVDLGGRPFTIYKFRTMAVDAEHASGPVWATKADPRVTPVGRVLRSLRLDELPQLINVIRGDMNLVGPRPERPTFVVELRREIPEYAKRHRVKPGLTGLAQVNLEYDSCVDTVRAKLEYDLEYIRRRSLLEDLKIMLKTVPVILFRKGGW
jgi:lipopolysaccharide/colanic/teichoic acid biosynthesis glycosyltransferase